jgi:glutaredoxin-related protein
MGMTGKTDLLKKNQMQAGYLMMVKCPEIVDLIDTWRKWNEDYHLIDDSPSILPNSSQFIEHRHDQSVFNILVKSRGLINYDAEPADNKIENPVWYCRNIDGPTVVIERPY